jgi:hypothetical protein
MSTPRLWAIYSFALTLLLGVSGHSRAASFTYTALNTDGSNPANPLGINSQNVVVGYTYNYNTGNREGFVWNAGTVTNVKGSGTFLAINDNGIAVAALAGESKNFATYDVNTGVLTDVPVSIAKGKPEVAPYGINAAGEVAGSVIYVNNTAKAVGFTWLNGASSKLIPPRQTQSIPVSINKKGEILINSGATYYNPFLFKNGKFKQFAVPEASTTTANFITDDGIVGGNFAARGFTSGFVLTGSNYTTYNPPGATYSTVTGIGPSKQVYGTFTDLSGNTHGFVNVSGTFFQVDVPGSTYTQIIGVSTSGSIFGTYNNSQGSYGYIGNCPKKDVCTQ